MTLPTDANQGPWLGAAIICRNVEADAHRINIQSPFDGGVIGTGTLVTAGSLFVIVHHDTPGSVVNLGLTIRYPSGHELNHGDNDYPMPAGTYTIMRRAEFSFATNESGIHWLIIASSGRELTRLPFHVRGQISLQA